MNEKHHEHKEHGHKHECEHGCEHDTEDLDIGKDFDRLTMEEVVYGNQHVLNILLDLLIEKGIVSEQELKDKLDQMIAESPEAASIKFDAEEDEEEVKF